MLSPEEIKATYGELEKMFVPVRPEPELGMAYIKERLALCRAMQDRLAELRLKSNQHLSDVEERVLIAKGIVELTPTPDAKKGLRELELHRKRHTTLTKMIAMQAQVLSRTGMDIKLFMEITKEQLHRGEINPKEAGLVQQAQLGTDPAPEPVNDGPTSNVGFDEAVVEKAEDDRMKLADTAAVSFDDLFGGLNGPAATNPF